MHFSASRLVNDLEDLEGFLLLEGICIVSSYWKECQLTNDLVTLALCLLTVPSSGNGDVYLRCAVNQKHVFFECNRKHTLFHFRGLSKERI